MASNEGFDLQELVPIRHAAMDPLPQYGSHAFIPYLENPPPASNASPPPTKPSPSPAPTLLNTSTWTYCGPLLSPSAESLPPSFHTWSQTTFTTPLLPRLLPLLSFLHSFLSAARAQNYWLTIRATKPTNEYDTVRWHTDDVFFDYDGEKDRLGPDPTRSSTPGSRGYWKLATTLLGPGTLFLKDGVRARRIQRDAKRAECERRGEHTCTQFRCLGCLDAVEAVRKTLAREFADEEVERTGFGEVAFFRLGDEEGAVHSEPKCDVDRVFINVVPGSEEELKALMERWGLGFPRAWCFGVPVGFGEESADAIGVDGAKDIESRADTPVEQQGQPANQHDKDDRGWSLSTMSMNLRNEYMDWLKDKGFQFAQIFGQGQPQQSKLDTLHA
ncbi:hypothetical protein BU24DRAFT_416933 [Aaosphaeria arxii CBS 175.79]|uniref:Uncharacterized protein n=1 Tax=Aaosphaeria arxii CBS 175.79 TaxID=1450172 RepID=A0A6A5Y9K3_9PLEO|nr:uncharacterized protein BU24DRAFT_416933 [Aaosphaeria arxii CBS 175.79]KAF2021274.1 hypothetical protein BU24DRAFT_416933 [Aaosphaeria arxii CBS 175.79]